MDIERGLCYTSFAVKDSKQYPGLAHFVPPLRRLRLIFYHKGHKVMHKDSVLNSKYFLILFYSRRLYASFIRAAHLRKGCSNYLVLLLHVVLYSFLHNLYQKLYLFYKWCKSVLISFFVLLLLLSFLFHALIPAGQIPLYGGH